MDINWTSLLTGVAGGIIPAAVAYYMGKRNIEASLEINAQKIEADRATLEKQYQIELEKINFEEKKKSILEYFEIMKPDRLFIEPLDSKKSERLRSVIYLLCPEKYFSYINRMNIFMITNIAMFNFHELWKDENNRADLSNIMCIYDKYYNEAWAATQKLFRGEVIPAVPFIIDSRPYIS